MSTKIKWEGVITNIQGKVLEGLARYKYLTLSQMLDLKVGTTRYKYLWEQVKSLRDRKRPLVECHKFESPNPRKGRVEAMYYLSKKGKDMLINEFQHPEEQIKIPLSKTPAYKDYFHRKHTISFQIALDTWANVNGFTVPFFDTYFDMVGDNRVNKNLRAKTRIEFGEKDYFIPDGAFWLEGQYKQRLFLFEMYNGKDSRRVVQQLHKHAKALTERFTHQKYELSLKKSYTIILLFELESIKQAVIEKAKREFTLDGGQTFVNVQKYFLCKSLSELQEGNFYRNWTTLFGAKVEVF